MMLTVTVRFLHETIRAGSPDDTVMAGGEPEGEWPPSPARLFSALVAADGTRDRCRVTDGSELAELESLGAPRILADKNINTTTLRSRFVVKDATSKGLVQNYPGRTSSEVRPGAKLSPETPLVAYVWDADVDNETVVALRKRAARVGYLGCADSPVQVAISTRALPEELTEWRPGAPSGVALPVPYPGFMEALDHAFDEWSAGKASRRSWIPTRRERYAPAARIDESETASPTTIWLELDHRVAGRRALLLTETLRAAVLDHYDRLSDDAGPSGTRAPWQLHGHAVPDDITRPYQIARYLPLCNVGHVHSDGAVHGAAIWLPPGTPPDVIERVRAVTYRLGKEELVGAGLRVRVAIRDAASSRKWSTQPERWSRPATRWFSATPVVAQRGRRGGPRFEDVCKWFEDAGYPRPSEVNISPTPTATGVVKLAPWEVHRNGKNRYPYYWLDVTFGREIEGPICIGRNRSFGMGLLAPVIGESGRQDQQR